MLFWYNCLELAKSEQSSNAMRILRYIVGRLLCLIGQHDFELVEATFAFGQSGYVQKVKCRRCGHVTTRQDPSA